MKALLSLVSYCQSDLVQIIGPLCQTSWFISLLCVCINKLHKMTESFEQIVSEWLCKGGGIADNDVRTCTGSKLWLIVDCKWIQLLCICYLVSVDKCKPNLPLKKKERKKKNLMSVLKAADCGLFILGSHWVPKEVLMSHLSANSSFGL